MMRRHGCGKAALLVMLLGIALVMVACSNSVPAAKITLTDDSFTLGADGTYTLTVKSSVDTLDVLNYFEVNDGFTLKLYRDVALTVEVDGDPALDYGENIFYLCAEPTGKGKSVTHAVKITREQGYAIIFMDGTTEVGRIYVDAGELIGESQVPTPAPKAGYTFGGWNGLDLSAMPTGDATYQAVWTANTDTPYKVEHYLQNAGMNGYDLHETENLTGTTDTTATATPKTTGDYEGYEVNSSNAGSLLSGNIAGDGSLVLKVYYDHIKYDVTYDFNTATDITADGVRYEGIEAAVLYGEQLSFKVFVNEDYNRSAVKYKFTPAGGEPVELTGEFNRDEKSYTYAYALTKSGTVTIEGEYRENKYAAEVNLSLTLYDPEWGTISTLDEVKIKVGDEIYSYADAEENKLSLSLKYGTYTVSVVDGERTTDFTLFVNPEGWDEKKETVEVYSVDVTMTVGYSRIEVAKKDIEQNLDGTLGAVTTGNNAIKILDGDTSGDFAVRMRYTITNMAVDWSALDFRIGTLQLYLSDVDVLVNANGTKIGSAADGKTRFDTEMSTALLLRTGNNAAIATKPFIVDYTIVRLYDDQLRIYFGVVDNDNPEKETWYYVGNITKTALNIVGAASVPLPAAGATVIGNVLTSANPSLSFTQNNNFTLTYSHYGVSNSFLYGSVEIPESVDSGTLTATHSGNVKVGDTVTVTATPAAEMAVTAFTVKKNGGTPVTVDEAGFGSVSGEPDVARVFTFTLDNLCDTYEFGASFALSEYVTVEFEATYPSWYNETDDVLTVTADTDAPAIASYKGDGAYEVKLRRGTFGTVTVSSARFRVSDTVENKSFSNVAVSGGTNLTGGTPIVFTLIKLTASGTNNATYPDGGIRLPSGNTNYYSFAGVEATEGFTIKYSMKAATANQWVNGGFFFNIGGTYYTLMVYSSQGLAGKARLQITQNTGTAFANCAGVITTKDVGALSTAGITVEIAYYSEAFYVRIDGDFAVRFGKEIFASDRHCTSNACSLYFSDGEWKKATGQATGAGVITTATYFGAGTRTLGLRAADTACTFTGVEYALGNAAAKALVDDMRQHAKNDDAVHGSAWAV